MMKKFAPLFLISAIAKIIIVSEVSFFLMHLLDLKWPQQESFMPIICSVTIIIISLAISKSISLSFQKKNTSFTYSTILVLIAIFLLQFAPHNRIIQKSVFAIYGPNGIEVTQHLSPDKSQILIVAEQIRFPSATFIEIKHNHKISKFPMKQIDLFESHFLTNLKGAQFRVSSASSSTKWLQLSF